MFFLLLLLGIAPDGQARLRTPRLLQSVHVVDPEAESVALADVWLDAGRIESVTPEGARSPSSDELVIDGRGLFLTAGLMDLHSHLLLHPYNETSWEDQVLRESSETRTLRGILAARSTLQAGFTLLRDLGSEGAGYADVALRDALEQGWFLGPRLLVSTRAIVATGCYGPAGFAPHVHVPSGAQVADGTTEVRRAVREQVAGGADWIKVYADYRRTPGGPVTPTFSVEELAALVDEASSAGRPVAAHATTPEAIQRAVRAGVQTIEHGTEATPEILREMTQRGVVLCPTLTAYESIARYQGWTQGEPEPARLRAARRLITAALAAGTEIVCGSDVGVFRHGDNARELELLHEFGMPRAAVLRAATTVAAGVVGRGQDLGRVRAGYVADLVLWPGNPLESLRVLRSPAIVMKGGVVADEPGERGPR